jgi:hypothetical protein
VRCVECGHVKDSDERGWVTVLSPSSDPRIHYCCSCMESLVRRARADEAEEAEATEE